MPPRPVLHQHRFGMIGSMPVARFQQPNPLDLFFFAADRALRRLGLPGAYIHLCLEMRSRCDIEGLKRALGVLYRVYPAAGSRLECSPITGRPRWRLDEDPPNLDRVVRVYQLAPATESEWHRQVETLLGCRTDPSGLPPVRFHVFRGLASGDRLVMRWPHAFMDGRGGVTLLEEIDRLYQQKSTPSLASTAGDESRDDFGRLIAGVPHGRNPRALLDGTRGAGPSGVRIARLASEPISPGPGPLRCFVRRLSAEQTRRAEEAALRTCGFGRFGDFVRACAIAALHRAMPRPLPTGASYCILNLIDHRKRRHRAPVCRNLTGGLPIFVPVGLASDRRAVADLAREQTAAAIASGAMVRRLVAVQWLTRLPTGLLVHLMHRSMSARHAGLLPAGMGNPPSLPLGFIGSFSKRMPTFCGGELVNIFGLRPAPFQSGLSVDVNKAQDRINLAGMFFESRISAAAMNTFLDDFVAALLAPT